MNLRPLGLAALLFAVGCPGKPDDTNADDSTADDSTADDTSTDDTSTDDTNDPTEGITNLTISPDPIALYRYERVDLSASGLKDGTDTVDLTGEVSWSSADENIAWVSPEGQIEGRGEGSTTLTATLGELTDTVDVTVSVFSLTGSVTLHGLRVGNVSVDVVGPVDSATYLTSEVDGLIHLDGLGVGTYTLTATLGDYIMQPGELTLTLPDDAAVSPEISIVSAAYPSEADLYEPDDSAAQSSLFAAGGPLQQHTLWPYTDVDWFQVQLLAGTDYELFTANLCATCDSRLRLYDVDGTTQIAENDDQDDAYNSRILFTPEADGTYFFSVEAYEPDAGVVSYFVGVGTTFDNDGDNHGAYDDCDDNNANVHAFAREEPDNGLDDNCDGYAAPSTVSPDADEGANDSAASAISMGIWDGFSDEYQYQGYWTSQYARTLHSETDEDWFHVQVPAHSVVYLVDSPDSQSVTWTVWDSTLSATWFSDTGFLSYSVVNEDDNPMDVYIQANGATAEGAWYLPYAIDIGTDLDEDGYSTQDWDYARDCDDSDASIVNDCY